ncbi:MAG: hypothetical protein ACI9QD_000701 [Thermoproteota archaeon]|jgi:hypothetical protein
MAEDKYPFGKFGPEHLEKIKPGIKCYNDCQFWECHEVLEDVWIEDAHDLARNVYWAVIQVAAALYHYENKNLVGAKSLLKKSREKFTRCEDKNILTHLVHDYLDWNEFKEVVFAINVDTEELSDFKKLHEFKFKEYPW